VVLASYSSPLNEQETPSQTKQELDSSELTRQDVLALHHLQPEHISSEERLSDMVSDFLSTSSSSRSISGEKTTIAGIKKFTSKVDNGFSSVTANARSASAEPEPSEIPFYLFELENTAEDTKGFALTCGDDRIGNVLALVENGSVDLDNPFMDIYYTNLESYIAETIDFYNNITDDDIYTALEKINQGTERAVTSSNYYDFNTNGSTLLETQWNQWEPYWDIINEVKGRTNWPRYDKYLTGCTATAMAQVMAFWKYPNKCSIEPYNNINYVWNDMKAYPNATNLTTTGKRAVAALMYEAAEKLGTDYGTYN
jgi:hypothetical protein